MSKHTPGPWNWVIEDCSMATLGQGLYPGLGDPHVLTVGPCKSCLERRNAEEWEWGVCRTPTQADAILIAAAPMLLKELQHVVRWYDQLTQNDIDRYRATIATATGNDDKTG